MTPLSLLRSLLLCASAALPAVPVAAATSPTSARQGPVLAVDEEMHHFGDAWEGTRLQHTFTLTSAGTTDLVIDKLHSSCGCTVAKALKIEPDGTRSDYVEGTPIAPGSKIEVAATVDTTGRAGKLNKAVTVYCNDPRGRVELALKAKVNRILTVTGKKFRGNRLGMGRFSTREERSRTVTLTCGDDRPIRLELIEDTIPETFTVELEPNDPDADGRATVWTMSVTAAPNQTPGLLLEAIGVRTDRMDPKALEGEDGFLVQHVEVVGEVVGLVTISPSFCSFGILEDDQVTSRSFRVAANDPDLNLAAPTFALLEPDSDEPYELAEYFAVTVTPVPSVPGGAYDFEITNRALPSDLGRAFRGRVRLTFDLDEIRSEDVSFTGFHRSTAGSR